MALLDWAIWGRRSRDGLRVVVAVRPGVTWVSELPKLCPGVRIKSVKGGVELALLLEGADSLLPLLPPPKPAGSRTPGVLLPW